MTPYQLHQVERDRQWLRRRSKLLKQFYSERVAAITDELTRVVSGFSYMTSHALRREWSQDALQRQRWALQNPHARFKIIEPYYSGLAVKPRFDDENEMLYLLSMPPIKRT